MKKFSPRHERRLISRRTLSSFASVTSGRVNCEVHNVLEKRVPTELHHHPSVSEDLEEDGVSDSPLSLYVTPETQIESPEVHSLHRTDCDGDDRRTLPSELKMWALNHNITLEALTSLLKLLKPALPEQALPADGRTLLRTPRRVTTKRLGGGEYSHIGFQSQIVRVLKDEDDVPEELEIDISVDGIPISNSSGSQLWPIQGRIVTFPRHRPFCIGIYHGEKKPDSAAAYLQDFVSEVRSVLETGILWRDKEIKICLRAFICDAPARAFIKGIKGHTAYSGCEKCTQRGVYYKQRVCFLPVSKQLRTDQSFRMQEHRGHHNVSSPLLDLQVGLVSQVPLEYMHLVCLGVMRKILNLWTSSSKTKYKLSRFNVEVISERLRRCKHYTASEFSRKPRGLEELSHWKATEYRQFLLYLGPVVLKGMLEKSYYTHFLCLSVSITILLNEVYISRHFNYAKSLLQYFVKEFATLYGQENLSYNVHGLLHLPDDVQRFGPLDDFSAFPYENSLGNMKKLKRSTNMPLQQVVKRNEERQSLSNPSFTTPLGFSLEHHRGPTAHLRSCRKFKCANFRNFQLQLSPGNDWCMLKDGSVVHVQNFVVSESDKYIVGTKVSDVKKLFVSPCDSSVFGIVEFCPRSKSELHVWPLDSVDKKLAVVPRNGNFVMIPILHSKNE